MNQSRLIFHMGALKASAVKSGAAGLSPDVWHILHILKYYSTEQAWDLIHLSISYYTMNNGVAGKACSNILVCVNVAYKYLTLHNYLQKDRRGGHDKMTSRSANSLSLSVSSTVAALLYIANRGFL